MDVADGVWLWFPTPNPLLFMCFFFKKNLTLGFLNKWCRLKPCQPRKLRLQSLFKVVPLAALMFLGVWLREWRHPHWHQRQHRLRNQPKTPFDQTIHFLQWFDCQWKKICDCENNVLWIAYVARSYIIVFFLSCGKCKSNEDYSFHFPQVKLSKMLLRVLSPILLDPSFVRWHRKFSRCSRTEISIRL